MGYFDRDGGGGGAVNPVYLQIEGHDLLQIFPLQYTEKHSCKVIGSPSEQGLEQLDNKVVQPSTVNFTGIVKYPERAVFKGIYDHIRTKRKVADLMCQFMSKAGRVSNMIVLSLEEVGDNKRYDGIEIRVSMQEYLEHNEA